MNSNREADEFRRMRIVANRERANELIIKYRDGIDHFRRKIDAYNNMLGRIEERLGEPEPEEHPW